MTPIMLASRGGREVLVEQGAYLDRGDIEEWIVLDCSCLA